MSLEKCAPNVPEIVAGEDKVLTIQLEDKKTKEFIDLTGASEIIALLKNADDTTLQKKLTDSGINILSSLAGKFQVLLSATETGLLALSPTGGYSDLEIRFTIAGKLTIVKLPNTILVTQKLFPNV